MSEFETKNEMLHNSRRVIEELRVEVNDLRARLTILRRYHGGDGTITREQVMKALEKP